MRCGLATADNVDNVNACLKKGILLGYITLDNYVKKESVLYRDSCVYCGKKLWQCSLADNLRLIGLRG